MNQKLHQSEERYRLLFDNAPISITVTDTSGFVIDCNKATEAFTGYPRESLVGKRFDQLATIDPLHLPRFADNLKKLALGQDIEPYTLQMIRSDGEKRWIMVRHSLLKKGDTVIGIQVFATDITARKEAEDALRESEEKLRILFESIGDAITVTDLSGRIIEVNEAALHIGGFECKDKAELIGRDGFELVAEKDRDKVREGVNRAFKSGQSNSTIEYTLRTKHGTEYNVEVSVSFLYDRDGKPAGVITITKDVTERKRMNELIQFYITEITRAQEEERKRIARELHDDTAQGLAALMLDIESVINTKKRLPKNVIDELEHIRGKADDIMQGVRRFSTEMRPGVLDQLGLVAALGWLADSIGDGIGARVELTGKERRLISEAELVLFRIAQEALSNVRKHSGATQVLITVEFAPRKVRLEVKDNGRGFELPKKLEDFAARGRLGILGMNERARIIAGNLSIQSAPGSGTVVSIEVAK